MLGMLTALAAAFSAPAFVEKPCAKPELAKVARCGSVVVPENRQRRGGRVIALNLVILPATGARDMPPLFDLEGGPGLPATKNADFYLTDGRAYRARRDIVLLDQRGTGGSNPLHCPELNTADPLLELFSVEGVRTCRERLEKIADLRRYGTVDAVADLDDVRRALGAPQIDIVGLSYGTTVALRYLTTYPDKARSAILMGTAPPSAMPPQHHAAAGDIALSKLFADCAADAACRAAFPDPEHDLRRWSADLDNSTRYTKGAVLEKLRALLYAPAVVRRVPLILNRAAAGDWEPFLALTKSPLDSLYADGMFLSVTCTEGIGLMNFQRAAARARETSFGDYRLQRQREVCRAWPKAKVARDHLKPLRADARILLISGGRDPVTPPAWADDVQRLLPNSQHFIVEHGGHILEGLPGAYECVDAMALAFLDRGEVKVAEARCLIGIKPAPFVLR